MKYRPTRPRINEQCGESVSFDIERASRRLLTDDGVHFLPPPNVYFSIPGNEVSTSAYLSRSEARNRTCPTSISKRFFFEFSQYGTTLGHIHRRRELPPNHASTDRHTIPQQRQVGTETSHNTATRMYLL